MSSTAEREGLTSHGGLSIVLPTFNEGGSIRQVIESLLRLETDHPLEILVVDDDAFGVLGSASISYNVAMRYSGEYCQLEELFVDPAARGKNAGGLLIEGIIAAARERGCAEIGLYLVEWTTHNQPFYEKYGFEVVGAEMRQRLG